MYRLYSFKEIILSFVVYAKQNQPFPGYWCNQHLTNASAVGLPYTSDIFSALMGNASGLTFGLDRIGSCPAWCSLGVCGEVCEVCTPSSTQSTDSAEPNLFGLEDFDWALLGGCPEVLARCEITRVLLSGCVCGRLDTIVASFQRRAPDLLLYSYTLFVTKTRNTSAHAQIVINTWCHANRIKLVQRGEPSPGSTSSPSNTVLIFVTSCRKKG